MMPTGVDPDAAHLRVERLRIHPVKGARGYDVQSLDFDEIGPAGDRRWMIVRPNGEFVSQRSTPALATIAAELGDDSLTLRAPKMPALALPLLGKSIKPPGRMQVRIWNSVVEASRVDHGADRWLEELLGAPHRLVYMGPGDRRATDPEYARGHRVSFADGYPALVIGRASVEELCRRAGRSLSLERFRPNIVVAGAPPHEEDFWRRFAIGDHEFRGVKLCARCQVPTLDQTNGERDPEGEPLRTLARYRRIESLVYFGLNAVHSGPAQIGVGDRVRILERGIVRGALHKP